MSDMKKRVFRRKIYDAIGEWKRKSNGQTALLIEGARRIGKSTIVEKFAKEEYRSYILIDFNKASQEVKSLFNDLMDLILSSFACNRSILRFFMTGSL